MVNKKRGFTPVDVLVVVGIMAVVFAIVMSTPASQRRQARRVLCQANLRQWGVVFSTYANDNNGYNHNFWPSGVAPDTFANWYLRRCAVELFKSINPKLLMCPSSSITGKSGAQAYVNWQLGDPAKGSTPVTGSYGENLWATNSARNMGGVYESKNFWKRMGVAGSDRVPLFMDSVCPYMFPMSSDSPPYTSDGQYGSPVAPLKYPCLDRHGGGTINILFLDGHVRTAGLKELWTLKWSTNFNTENSYTKAGGMTPGRWPLWMQGFKDY
jgi:prepilin-type processing-associated H-X9-DG protein